jgi:hypothetical protein
LGDFARRAAALVVASTVAVSAANRVVVPTGTITAAALDATAATLGAVVARLAVFAALGATHILSALAVVFAAAVVAPGIISVTGAGAVWPAVAAAVAVAAISARGRAGLNAGFARIDALLPVTSGTVFPASVPRVVVVNAGSPGAGSRRDSCRKGHGTWAGDPPMSKPGLWGVGRISRGEPMPGIGV